MPRLTLILTTAVLLAATGSAALDPADTLAPRNTQAPGEHPPAPAEALAALTLPPELAATVFAAEPDVRQPIDMKVDDRGRVWVCEAYSYGEWARRGQDRILILSDEDGDGVADGRTLFRGGFHHLSSVAVGFGGVWVLDSPHFSFIPDRDGDDVPDGEPVVLLDGWTTDAGHNVTSGLEWGPDGWLYGRHGITAPSLVGRPGSPKAERTFMEPGVWRFHPVTKKFEVVLRGMTNPWGLDWNEDGEMFLSGNVNGHLWHGLAGALYERMFGAGSVPHDYERLTMIGERPHYAGTGDWKADWLQAEMGRDPTNDLGGGHSHCGLLIYQGTAWPPRFRGHFLMCNTHGRRINEEIVEPRGAGYVSRHLGDPIRMGDPWFRGVSLADTPEGDVLLSDWSDHGECHDSDGVHRTSGRIYRIAARDRGAAVLAAAGGSGVAGRTDLELAALQTSPSEWHVRRARRLLQERAAQGTPTATEALARLREIMAHDEAAGARLRALWTLHALGAATAEDRLQFSKSVTPAHRTWAVRLIAEHENPSEAEMARLFDMAGQEPSPRVRLELASVVARLPAEAAWKLGGLVARNPSPSSHPERTGAGAGGGAPPEIDPTLELVLWHVLEPKIIPHADEAAALAGDTPFPKLRRFIARRLGAAMDQEAARTAFGRLLEAAAADPSQPWAKDVLAGAMTALQGRRNRPPPPQWGLISQRLLASGQPSAREAAVALSVAFNEASILDRLRRTLRSAAAGTETRIQALEGLRQAGSPDLPAVLLAALNEPPLRLAALRGIGSSTEPAPAEAALALWPQLSPEERTAAVDALAGRAATARLLLQKVAEGAVHASEISVTQARQLAALDDDWVEQALATLWGSLTAGREEAGALISRYRALLTSPPPAPPDPARGRLVFGRACGACHVLFGEGGPLGPDLTGGGRKDLDYLLQNVLNPSAVVPRDYKMTVVTLHDGQVLSGVIPAQDETTLTVQTLTERRVIDRSAIREIEPQALSWMPEGLFQTLAESDLRDLVAYLQSDPAR